ncbi:MULTISPECIES: RDD family protein [unclassified Campylobacter]|uniref:RDD family protein n=1 Tax=unclassified Campylobacter TaxID=2593542 RepID=UPI001473795C|nr:MULTISPECIES: RDD family protein [unclassified Campylobacter]
MAKQKAVIASIPSRIKAFITDVFFILIPILYITTYAVLDGKNEFQNNQLAIFITNFLFGVIICLFQSIKAQTPGYKSQDIYLVNLKNGQKLGFFHALLRYICFVLAGFSLVGICLCFFRKDKLNLHDLLTNSAAVSKKQSI